MILAAAKLGQSAADGAAGHCGGLAYRLHPATARRQRFARRDQPTTALVKKRRDRRKARPDGDDDDFSIAAHVFRAFADYRSAFWRSAHPVAMTSDYAAQVPFVFN